MIDGLRFPPVALPPETAPMRARIREFLTGERARGAFAAASDSWAAADPDFSRRLGEAGFLGMTWPKRYGGGEHSAFERYVVIEELLAAGAPVGAHWIADRQSGPQILRNGADAVRDRILPEIAAGRCYFAIGMSEPDVGSDLAAVATRAVAVDGGWRVNGRKVWTSFAHGAHYLIALVRTAPKTEVRHSGLTQVIVDLASPGVTVRPIENLSGGHDFNEVVFDDLFVPDAMVLGGPGRGWQMVTSELAFERSGPERFMSAVPLLVKAIGHVGPEAMDRTAADIGRLAAHLIALRQMSLSVAGMLQRGEPPNTQAALVKDLGAVFEQETPDAIRRLADLEPAPGSADPLAAELAHTIHHAPSFSLRGGTREILRGIIAKELGLR